MAEDILTIYQRWLKFNPLDADLVARQKDTVVQIVQAGRSRAAALETAASAVFLAEHLIARVEGEGSLPRPLACGPGCPHCCFNQVELTPPEALLLGEYVDRHFSPAEKEELRRRLAGNLARKAGKGKKEVALIRSQLPCPFLKEDSCGVYPARPLLCRAMHSLDARQCREELSNPLSSFEFYSHRYEIVLSVSAGLVAGAQALGCQWRAVDLAQAVQDYLAHPRPAEAWLAGEEVFTVPAR